MNLEQKRIVITGATSGIGKVLLEELLRFNGVQIVMAILPTGEPLESHPQVTPYICDVSSQLAIDKLLEFAQLIMGGIDLVISNAGFAYYEEIGQPDYQRIAKIFQTNTFASIYLAEKMQILYPNSEYKIVITASSMAEIPIPGYALYSATKAALHAFAVAYRYQLTRASQLCLVYPIATKTKFFQNAGERTPIPFPTQTSEQVAQAIIRGIERDQRNIYPSKIFQLIKLLNKLCPLIGKVYQNVQQKKLQQWKEVRAGKI